jgi:DNA-binding CsgD family transcriptional regulator
VDATPDELDAALVEAVRAGVLVGDAASDTLGFRHALLREATDRATGPGARRSWHRRWAEVLEGNPGVLAADPAALAVAEHWHHARDVRRAMAAAVAALPAAERIGDPVLETRLWRRVLEGWSRVDDPETVTGVSLREAVALAITTAQPAAMGELRSVLDAVPQDLMTSAERAVLRVLGATAGEAKGEIARRYRGLASELFDSHDLFAGPRDLFSMYALTIATRLPSTDERSQRGLELAAEISRELGSQRGHLGIVMLRSHSRQFVGDPQGAGDYLERELAGLRDEPDDFALFLVGNLMWCRAVCGCHREAQRIGDEALARLRHPELSLSLWEHLVENHSFSLTCTGDWDRARRLLEESAPWWEDDVRTSNARLDLLAVAQRGTTDASRWRSLGGEGVPNGAHPVIARHVVAAAHAAGGDLGAARRDYRALWADDSAFEADDYLWCVLRDASRAEADAATVDPDRDDHVEASLNLQEIAEGMERCRRYGVLGEVWPLDVAAQLDRFHGRDARPALEAALAGWERVGHVPDVGVTHLSLAEAHAIHGERDAARHHLSAGQEIAARLESRPMLSRADAVAERFALASRDRRTSDVLTAREAEVLALVAEGRTNAEIAATLFMSPKTASVHVSHIIAKLGAANRTEAAATARRQGLLQ